MHHCSGLLRRNYSDVATIQALLINYYTFELKIVIYSMLGHTIQNLFPDLGLDLCCVAITFWFRVSSSSLMFIEERQNVPGFQSLRNCRGYKPTRWEWVLCHDILMMSQDCFQFPVSHATHFIRYCILVGFNFCVLPG